MKNAFFTILISVLTLGASAQKQNDIINIDTTAPVVDFTAIDTQPMFPGGYDKLYQYIGKNLKSIDASGIMKVAFIVETDGRLTDIKVPGKLSPKTDAEVIRVLKKSPKWQPAMKDGKPLRVLYTIPVTLNKTPEKVFRDGEVIIH